MKYQRANGCGFFLSAESSPVVTRRYSITHNACFENVDSGDDHNTASLSAPLNFVQWFNDYIAGESDSWHFMEMCWHPSAQLVEGLGKSFQRDFDGARQTPTLRAQGELGRPGIVA